MDKFSRRWRDERASIWVAAAQAGAIQRVIDALRGVRMEVHIEDFPRVTLTHIVPGMLPLTADARITQRATGAIHLAEWRTQLTAMRDLVERYATAS